MEWLYSIVSNPFLIIGVSSWFIAQVLKIIIHTIMYKKLDLTRMYGDGGMPSGHSATVSSVAAAAGLVYGTGSYEFALAMIFAIIVCHDAMGVRRETGRQAVVINEIIRTFSIVSDEKLPEENLKELVGHSPVQVFAGIIIGICNAFLMHSLLF